LVEAIKDEDEHVWLVPPEIIDHENIEGFTFSFKNSNTYADLRFRDYFQSRSRNRLFKCEDLKNHKINLISSEGTPLESWPLKKCIHAEISHSEKLYLLCNGKWYELETSYCEQIENYFEKNIEKNCVVLQKFKKESEASYNKTVAGNDPGKYQIFDGPEHLIHHGDGRSSIEFCDIYCHRPKQFIHIKRYSGSATLSHLFSQGIVSAETFLIDKLFRKKVNQKLKSKFKMQNPEALIEPGEYHIVFGIVCDREELRLPFFSLVNLRRIHKKILGMGYRMSLTHIRADTTECEDAVKK
jgi:uncharacterized protein (TIGR04141 family)